MTEYKQIYEKEIYVIMKKWDGGKLEFVGAYWSKDIAKRVAADNITGGNPYITISPVMLHGAMIDKA